MSDVKLCRDCKHVVARFDPFWSQCGHKAVPVRDLSTGERERAGAVRRHGPCGSDGRYFEPKNPPKPATPEDPHIAELLSPAEHGRRVGWWDRQRARLAKWVRS